MSFHKVKKFGKSSLHVILSRQDMYEVGDDVEIVKVGAMFKSKEMELWIREVVRAELKGKELNISYDDKKSHSLSAVSNNKIITEIPGLDEDL